MAAVDGDDGGHERQTGTGQEDSGGHGRWGTDTRGRLRGEPGGHRTLRQVHDLLAPGGLFAVVEPAGFPRFLPESAPEDAPGLEERCHAALDHHAEHVPHRGADWGTKLTEAGFAVGGERTITVNIASTHTDAVGRYALSSPRRIRGSAASAPTAKDLTALDQLLDTGSPRSIPHRGDLRVRTERTVWAARRT